MHDSFFTIKDIAKGEYRDSGSKFISFAHPITQLPEVEQWIKHYRDHHAQANHVCSAFIFDNQKHASDDGEPRHSAGDPILNQIRSSNLNRVLVLVVRYFGGVKLGVPGLINAYKTATKEALSAAIRIKQYETVNFQLTFGYKQTSLVERLLAQYNAAIQNRHFGENCIFEFAIMKQVSNSFLHHASEVQLKPRVLEV